MEKKRSFEEYSKGMSNILSDANLTELDMLKRIKLMTKERIDEIEKTEKIKKEEEDYIPTNPQQHFPAHFSFVPRLAEKVTSRNQEVRFVLNSRVEGGAIFASGPRYPWEWSSERR